MFMRHALVAEFSGSHSIANLDLVSQGPLSFALKGHILLSRLELVQVMSSCLLLRQATMFSSIVFRTTNTFIFGLF